MSIGLYIDLAPLYLKYSEKLQEKRFDFIKSLASIIPENAVKVSKIKYFIPNQQTLYIFRWLVRNRKGIEMLVNLINITYCATKILPHQDEVFSKHHTESVQEFRFALSSQIREQVFYAIFVKNIKNHIKSNTIMNAL